MKKTILLLLIASVFVGCITRKPQTEKHLYYKLSDTLKQINIAELEHIRDFELPIENSKFNFIRDQQIVETDSGTFLFLAFQNYNKIFVYDLEKEQKINEIVLDRTDLNSFFYVNKDSIFLFYEPHSNLYYYHDSSLVMINEKNNVIKSYSWKDAPVWCTEKERDYEDSVSFAFLSFQKLAYSHQKIFMALTRFTQKTFGDSIYFSDKRPIVGYFDTKQNKFYPTKISFPSITGDYYYPYTYHMKFVNQAHDNSVNVSFLYTSEIFKYNIDSDKLVKYNIKSSVLDTIYPSITEKIPLNYIVPQYWGVSYNKYTKLYFRKTSFNSIFGKSIFTITDTNNNFVAEGIYPEATSRFNFTKDYILALNMEKTAKAKNKVVFSAYKLKYRKGTNQELISELKSEEKEIEKTYSSVTNFYKDKLNIKDKNYSATVVVWSSVCFSTVDFVLRHYQANEKKYEQNKVYLIIASTNEVQVSEQLKQDYNLNIDSLSNIFIVKPNEYLPFHNFSEIAPRISVVRKNKIVSDTIYSKPTEITEDLQNVLLKSSKEQKGTK